MYEYIYMCACIHIHNLCYVGSRFNSKGIKFFFLISFPLLVPCLPKAWLF